MAVSIENRKRVTSGLKSWLEDIAAYERAFKTWEARVEKILKRYKDDRGGSRTTWTESKFNILWSNVQTLQAATFSRLPKPDVSRRHRDQDPVGRVAALILERSLEYHVQHYPEYKTALKGSVLDRFLGARGTCWVRYEPHFRAAQAGGTADGLQVTEDVDTPDEELDYECVAVDYVHWKDFGHSVARTWEEVPRVWRKVYMTRDTLDARFGKDISKLIPLDADPRQTAPDKAYGAQEQRLCATIYEGWDKTERKAVWFSKAVKDFLDEKPDPLGLEDVFPCPPPLFGTLTNDSLVPVPDYVMYQDQANELDLLADKIDGLVKALKIAGGYDASVPELQRIFTEAENGTLIPVKNWQAFAEKNGLQGALSLVDLKPIAEALLAAYQAFEQVKQQVHEITGISDIIRGQTQASETATAQQIKGQYASLRLKAYQDEVSQYASNMLSIMGQVICRKFSPQTIAKISGADQLSQQDLQLVPKALELLVGAERMADPEAEEGPNPVREFRIEVAADSMVYLDEQAEQQARTEFLAAVGTYLKTVSEAVAAMPQQVAAVMVRLMMDMMKFGVTGYRVGKGIEGAFDEASEKLKQIAQQPPQPQVPPEVQVEQMKQQTEMQRMQAEHGLERERMGAELDMKRQEHMQNLQFEREKHMQTMQQQGEQFNQKLETDAMLQSRKQEQDGMLQSKKIESDTEVAHKKAELATRPQIQIGGKEELDSMKKEVQQTLEQAMMQFSEGVATLSQMMSQLQAAAKQMSAPKKVIRGPDGRIARVESETVQ